MEQEYPLVSLVNQLSIHNLELVVSLANQHNILKVDLDDLASQPNTHKLEPEYPQVSLVNILNYLKVQHHLLVDLTIPGSPLRPPKIKLVALQTMEVSLPNSPQVELGILSNSRHN